LKILFPNGTTTSLGFIRVHLTEDDTLMEAHVCNDAALNQALSSVKVICDMHYKLLFAHDKITIISPTNKVITKGIFNPPNWNINLEPTIEQSINQYVITHQLNAERVAFYHAAFGSPTISTFLQAIHKGFLTTIAELTFQMVRNNPPISLNIEAGHMKRHRQGLRTTSTKPYEVKDVDLITSEADLHPFDNVASVKVISSSSLLDTSHSDATGKLPIPSRQGSIYILIIMGILRCDF
jgi:hypothetical protein